MKFLILLLPLFLVGCGYFTKPEVYVNDPIPVVAPLVQPLELKKITVNIANSSDFFDKPNQRLIILTEDNFKIYLENNVEFFRYISEQEKIIEFYETLQKRNLPKPVDK
jgi:hypothetical protein